MLGPGIVIFATRLVLSFTKRKCSIIGWSEKPTLPVIRRALLIPTPPLKFMPESASTEVTPSRCSRKSKCQKARRNSPSVTAWRPISSWRLIRARISRSSISFRAWSESSPSWCLCRASFRAAVRKRLPTMSARKGGLVGCMKVPPLVLMSMHGRMARLFLGRHPEMLLEGGWIVDERSARTRVHDGAAVENDGAVGDSQDLLGMLLHHNGRHALVADDPLQGSQQFLDDDGGQALRGLVEQHELG